MQVGVMITNGNNVHPADYHAEVTAGKIIVVAETASDETKQASRELRKKVEAILVAHHEGVHDHEQAKLAEEGLDRCKGQLARRAEIDAAIAEKREPVMTTEMHDLDASEHVTDEIIDEIAGAARGTILEGHFANPEVQNVIREILHHETRSQMNVHREVHVQADINARKAESKGKS